ncbi:phosphate acetyltransferase [Limosilactobacillus vaginalis]|jgi:phosphate acetyltransferase|uniref:Phosphate acetyltransferase n=2 Tax=Limosilactobacillus vaginalis TaxID=1633 RepID=A0AAP3GU26_9LACO|nr:phosphate acetyltransferase [Limosilactobacillus vaginalis]PEH03937.1 phosphate acetyltransferase [Lactobacillus sp. UMNPBX5]EEJ40794.1 phosphate acetyltransferase [Limosilactobacillus vaginalis DSM 5837 = ATCC 49540]KRM48568.1 phosphate acetyltransferase [Limosilactobacillus vaginalis DSM 5837 = ATCC 49540]MCZ2465229.1 phosphate acetyltransferase [Limosilactobacillus vaginalis]MCZ3667851.1 phosphate acetyltransferase [Limosilactobacillus vaginalis]
MDLFDEIAAKVKGQDKTIVFPEGADKRILGAAVRLKNDDLVEPILLGSKSEIEATANENNFDITGLQIIDPAAYPEADKKAMFDALLERRKGKNTPEQVEKMLEDVSYFGTMLVYMGKADGMVSGAVHSTGSTVRPALQIIKTKPNAHRISGAFLMQKGDQRYIFADCAINIELDADTMAEVAVQSAETAKLFGIDPKVALLSFSTKGSAKGDMVTKVAEATEKVHEMEPELPADGEMQFDAAVVPSVGELKAPGSKVAGHANVFIFPSLEAGNIGYKIAQRFGGFTAVGPILQGLNAPIADLSRGCSEDDAYKVAIITAAQAL